MTQITAYFVLFDLAHQSECLSSTSCRFDSPFESRGNRVCGTESHSSWFPALISLWFPLKTNLTGRFLGVVAVSRQTNRFALFWRSCPMSEEWVSRSLWGKGGGYLGWSPKMVGQKGYHQKRLYFSPGVCHVPDPCLGCF